MAQMVNIPRDVEDPHYRYKMPVLRAKVEGRGNGIKTVIENMSEIAKALDRRPDYPTKFFGFELGALTTTDAVNDRYIVNGKHEAEDLAKKLDVFIAKFVLCGKCRNPETDMHIRNDNILLKCRACGAITPADVSHKLSTYIIKNPPTPIQKPTTDAKERREKKRQAEKERAQEAEDDDWAVPTTPEAVAQRRLMLLGTKDRLSAGGNDDTEETDDGQKESKQSESGDGEKSKTDLVNQIPAGTNPIPALQKFWATLPPPEEALRQVKALADANRWSDPTLLKVLFGSFFDKDIRTGFVHKARYLRLFVTNEKQQKIVLYCVEKLCQMNADAIKLVADLLHGLWQECVVDEEVLLKWYKHPHEQMPQKLSNKIRDAAKPFIDWLQTAEEVGE